MTTESVGGGEEDGDSILAERRPDPEKDATTLASSAHSSHVHHWKAVQKPGTISSQCDMIRFFFISSFSDKLMHVLFEEKKKT